MSMSDGATVGAVRELWRFPVKSMQGERLESAEIAVGGLVGDRAYALVEAATGKAVSAKRVNDFPGLLGFSAAFLDPPVAGRELPPVRIGLPDGSFVTSESGEAGRALSEWFGRELRLERTKPRPLGGGSTAGTVPAFEEGMDLPVPAGSFFDAFPVTVLTSSTLERLAALAPDSRFDARRFRMNLVVDTGGEEHGFLENGWVGRALRIGGQVRLGVIMHDPRCVMTTLAQDDLPQDAAILRTLNEHNRQDVPGFGRLACAGVYALVMAAGNVGSGQAVQLDGSAAGGGG